MNRLRAWISKIKHDERGVTLIEAVTTVALYMVIGGAFVYASMVIIDAREVSGEETASTISQSAMGNTFRDDISNATAVKLNELGNVVSVARTDGKCVNWTIAKTPEAETSELFRANAQGSAPQVQGASIAEGITEGAFSNTSGVVGIDLKFASGKIFDDSIRLNLAGNDGGGCW